MTRTLPDLSDGHADRTFSRLLDWHLSNGTRPTSTPDTPGLRWTNEEFGRCCQGFNEKTIRLWRSGTSLPNDHPTIERELFGDEPLYRDWRQELRDSYDRAKRARDSRLFTAAGPISASYDPREQWAILDSHGSSSLAELHLHPPRPGNELNTFYVDATLLVGVAEYEFEGETVFIGVRDAALVLESPTHQPIQGSMIGQRTGVEPSNFRRIPGGVEIIGPTDKQGRLIGDILGDEYVAIIEPVGDGEQPVTLSLVAARRSFSAMIDGQELPREPVLPVNKDAILNVLIYKLEEKDKHGRVLLAEARMQRRKPA